MASHDKIETAMAFVRENVGRLDLSAGLVADRLAVSRSVLYRLFKNHGGVACFIKRQRLLTLRQALSQPGDTRSIVLLASGCGFSSGALASRSFRAAFGVAPGRYRAACRARGVEAAEGVPRPAAWAEDAVTATPPPAALDAPRESMR